MGLGGCLLDPGWLEYDDSFLLGHLKGLFSGAKLLLVSGRVIFFLLPKGVLRKSCQPWGFCWDQNSTVQIFGEATTPRLILLMKYANSYFPRYLGVYLCISRLYLYVGNGNKAAVRNEMQSFLWSCKVTSSGPMECPLLYNG